MLEFISTPAIVAIVFVTIYKLFELFVRRNERLTIVQKLAENNFNGDGKSVNLDLNFGSSNRFMSLRFGACLLGVGVGLIVGFIISALTYPSGLFATMDMAAENLSSIVIGASVLTFGGLAMLISFLIERKMSFRIDN